MNQYKALLQQVWEFGEQRGGRNGFTHALFGCALRFDLAEGFPAVTIKQLMFKSVAAELAGFLRAETDASKMGSPIWLANAFHWSGTSYMGKIYGYLWRKWNSTNKEVDQLALVVQQLKNNPYSRRHVVTAWDPGRMDEGCLPPCHYAFQFYVSGNNKLSCLAHMRSVDCVIGLPFDIASYALLTHIVAQQCRMQVGELCMTFGDTHIYNKHEDAYTVLIQREPLQAPQLVLDPEATIDNFTPNMAMLVNYFHHEKVQAELFV